MSQNSAPAAVSPNDLAVQIVTEAFESSPDTAKLLDLMDNLAALVKNEKDDRRLEPRDQAFAVVEQCLIDRRDTAGLIRLLRKKAVWTGDRPAYGSECLSVLAAAASKDRLALAKIESAGFGRERPTEALDRLSRLLSLKPGSVVAHDTWGYGVVKSEDDYYKNATIEFDAEPGRPKALGFSFAAEALSPIGPDHLLSVRHADRAAFDERCRKEPGEIVKLALKSWGNLTVSKLQAKLEPFLPAGEDWKAFWELARKQLARDEAVRLPAATKKADAVEMSRGGKRDAAAELDKEYKAFAALRDPKEILEKVVALAKKGGDRGSALTDAQRAAVADRIGFVLKACVADRKKLGNGAKVRAIMLGLSCGLSEVPVTLRPGAEEDFAFASGGENKSVALVGTLCRPDVVLDAATAMPASLMEELAEDIPLATDAGVAADYVAVLPDMPANLMEHLAPRLLVGAAKAEFAEKVRSEITKARPSFQLLRWLCHAAATKDLSGPVLEIVPPFALVSIAAVSLESEAAGEALRMKNDIKKLFVAGRRDPEAPKAAKNVEIDDGCKWLAPLMDRMSRDERASVFARLSAMDGVWEPLRKRRMLDFLRETYKGIEVLPETDEAEEKLEAFVRLGITSARSYNERQARLDKLVKEEIPQNIRDIEFAKGFGDLSENFEYQTARDRERELMARQATLQKDLADVSAFDFSQVAQNGLAGVGSFVTVRGADGAERSYAILGEWDSDPELGIVSSRTPIAQALFGSAEGDKVELPGEDGASEVATVVSVAALPENVLAWARG